MKSGSAESSVSFGRKFALNTIGLVLAAGAIVFILVRARTAFVLILVAAFLAVALNHAVEWLRGKGLRRGLAIALVLVTTLGIAVGTMMIFVPIAIEQGRQLTHRLPEILQDARRNPTFRTLDADFGLTDQLKKAAGQVPTTIEKAAVPALTAVTSLFSVLAAFLTVSFLTVFMLIFGGKLVHQILREAIAERRVRYRRVLNKIYRSIGGYLTGIAFICLVNATLTTIILAILRIPFFLPLGIISGSASLVPYAGPVVIGTLITLFTLATGGLWKAAVMAIFYVVYGQLEGNVLAPLVFKRTVRVNPLVSILSLVVMGELAGVAGAIAAVPLAAAGQVILRELLITRREKLNLPLTGEAGSVKELPQREVKKLAAEEDAHRKAEQVR